MSNGTKTGESRASIIQSVQTPLGFFTLVVLITEAILGLLAAKASGVDFTILVVSMIAFIFMLISIVAYLSHVSPKRLTVSTNESEDDALPVLPTDLPLQFREQYSKLKEENEKLRVELTRLTSLKSRVWTALNDSNSVHMERVLYLLGADKDPKLKDEVYGIVGALLEEGRIKKDGTNSGYFRVK